MCAVHACGVREGRACVRVVCACVSVCVHVSVCALLSHCPSEFSSVLPSPVPE